MKKALIFIAAALILCACVSCGTKSEPYNASLPAESSCADASSSANNYHTPANSSEIKFSSSAELRSYILSEEYTLGGDIALPSGKCSDITLGENSVSFIYDEYSLTCFLYNRRLSKYIKTLEGYKFDTVDLDGSTYYISYQKSEGTDVIGAVYFENGFGQIAVYSPAVTIKISDESIKDCAEKASEITFEKVKNS